MLTSLRLCVILCCTFQTRENFDASRADIQALMRKMLEVRQSVSYCKICKNSRYSCTMTVLRSDINYSYFSRNFKITCSWSEINWSWNTEQNVYEVRILIPNGKEGGSWNYQLEQMLLSLSARRWTRWTCVLYDTIQSGKVY